MAKVKAGFATLEDKVNIRTREANLPVRKLGKTVRIPNYMPITYIELKKGESKRKAIERFLNKKTKL